MTITLEQVSKRFGDHVAIEDASLEIVDGSLTALLGPSGSGKSTLLRMVAGLERPDTGRVSIDGVDRTGAAPQERGIGFVFQHYAAFRHMTIAQNIGYGLRIRKVSRRDIAARVAELLSLVQLEGLGDRYPDQLSGGQRQRMALARALAPQPKVLLLDEPFGALDAQVREDLRAWLRNLHDEMHVTTILVTHDRDEAMEVADRIVVMNHARIEQVGTPGELYEHPVSEFVMEFLGPVNRIDGELVRPFDVELSTDPEPDTSPATIVRITHFGFDVRVLLRRADGTAFEAQVSRHEAARLDLRRDATVHVRTRHARSFTPIHP